MTPPRLVLVEGIPGSGKTTTSEALADAYEARGLDCGWAVEESADHPFFGREVRRRHREDDYDDLCIDRWRAVVDASRSRTWILDGCALQNTVRFMFEQCWDHARILDYWQRFEEVVEPTGVRIVHLRQDRPEAFVRDHTMVVREAVWAKIERHVRSTPVGQEIAREHDDVHVEFWVRYARLSRDLVDRSSLPVLVLDVGDGWSATVDDATNWLFPDTRPEI